MKKLDVRKIVSVLVPVTIAAVSALMTELGNKQSEERMTELESKVAELESKKKEDEDL